MGALADRFRMAQEARKSKLSPTATPGANTSAAPSDTPTPTPAPPSSVKERFAAAQKAKKDKKLQPVASHGAAATEDQGLLDALYNVTVKPIVEHPGRNIGGIIGGIAGGALAAGSDVYTGGAAIPTNVGMVTAGAATGGMLGQKVEDWIRGTKYDTPMHDLENQFSAFLEQGSAALTAEAFNAIVQQYARLGVKGAINYLKGKPSTHIPVSTTPPPGGYVPKLKVSKPQAKINENFRTMMRAIGREKARSPEVSKSSAELSAGVAKEANTAATRAAKDKAAKKVSEAYGTYQQLLDADVREPASVIVLPEIRSSEGKVLRATVLNDAPMKAPLEPDEIHLIRDNLKQVYQDEDLRALPETHPIKTLINRFMRSKLVKGTRVFTGKEAIELDALKKDIARTERLIKKETVNEPYKGALLGKIKAAIEPVIDKKIQQLSEKHGYDYDTVIADRAAGDQASAQKSLVFSSMPEAKKTAIEGYAEAAARFPKPAPPVAIEAERMAAHKMSVSTWIRHFVDGADTSSLDTYLALPGADKPPVVLKHVMDHINETQDWKLLDTMIANKTLDRLTEGNSTLRRLIPDTVAKIKKLQSKGRTNVISQAIRAANALKSFTPPALDYIPSAVRTKGEALAVHLDNAQWTKTFNDFLSRQADKIPGPRPGMIRAQMAASGMKELTSRTAKVAAMPAPPQPTQEAGGR